MEIDVTGKTILDLPMGANEAGAASVREYLIELLNVVIRYDEDVIKRPFGNSGWMWDLYEALAKAGYAGGVLDNDGYVEDIDRRAARSLLLEAVAALATK